MKLDPFLTNEAVCYKICDMLGDKTFIPKIGLVYKISLIYKVIPQHLMVNLFPIFESSISNHL